MQTYAHAYTHTRTRTRTHKMFNIRLFWSQVPSALSWKSGIYLPSAFDVCEFLKLKFKHMNSRAGHEQKQNACNSAIFKSKAWSKWKCCSTEMFRTLQSQVKVYPSVAEYLQWYCAVDEMIRDVALIRSGCWISYFWASIRISMGLLWLQSSQIFHSLKPNENGWEKKPTEAHIHSFHLDQNRSCSEKRFMKSHFINHFAIYTDTAHW